MSSYLVAFVVSDFESTTNEFTKWDNMTDQAFFVRPGDSEKATETSFSSSVIFYVMGQYVRTEYDLPKLDSVDIPGKVTNNTKYSRNFIQILNIYIINRPVPWKIGG